MELGKVYLYNVHTPPYLVQGKDRGVAYEISLGGDVEKGRKEIIYVTHPFKYKGFEFYREKEGYSPLFVLRDMKGRVLYGAYAPLQSIKQEDGTYLYRSGTATTPGGFLFPQDPEIPPVFELQTAYKPDKEKKRAGEVLFQVRSLRHNAIEPSQEVFKGKAKLREMVRAGDFLLSMDEVRYWTSMKVMYHPGLGIIFSSFWVALGGITLSTILKVAKIIGKGEKPQ